ncbi:MAG: hypothetical protein AB1593_12275 [Pseudomonadota bacterium]
MVSVQADLRSKSGAKRGRNQNADGSATVPEALRHWMGGVEILARG